MSITPAADGTTLVFRPRLVRAVGYAIGGIVMLAAIVMAVTVGRTIAEVVGYLAFGAGVLWFCHREASVRITAGPEALIIRNLFITRSVEWPEAFGVVFTAGDPWAKLDLADGDTVSLMALQRTDGKRGMAAARRLAGLITERGEGLDPSGI